MLHGNASGDCKVKPFLVYQSENSRIFSKNNMIKINLHVMWRANKKAWVMKPIKNKWMNEVSGLSEKKHP